MHDMNACVRNVSRSNTSIERSPLPTLAQPPDQRASNSSHLFIYIVGDKFNITKHEMSIENKWNNKSGWQHNKIYFQFCCENKTICGDNGGPARNKTISRPPSSLPSQLGLVRTNVVPGYHHPHTIQLRTKEIIQYNTIPDTMCSTLFISLLHQRDELVLALTKNDD